MENFIFKIPKCLPQSNVKVKYHQYLTASEGSLYRDTLTSDQQFFSYCSEIHTHGPMYRKQYPASLSRIVNMVRVCAYTR